MPESGNVAAVPAEVVQTRLEKIAALNVTKEAMIASLKADRDEAEKLRASLRHFKSKPKKEGQKLDGRENADKKDAVANQKAYSALRDKILKASQALGDLDQQITALARGTPGNKVMKAETGKIA